MPPLTLMIKPSSSLCNMRCRYCFYTDTARHRSVPSFGLMTAETLELLVKRVFEYADRSVNLIFQGGEPTLAGLDFYRRLFTLEERYNTKGLPVSHSLKNSAFGIGQIFFQTLQRFSREGFVASVPENHLSVKAFYIV